MGMTIVVGVTARMRILAAVALFGSALWTAQGAAAPAPVNGICDDSVVNGCSAGQLNDAVFPDGPAVHVWRCDGLNGGANSEKCVRWVVVDGVCDESVRNGCSAGRPNDGAFPDRPDAYVWRCDGINIGQNSGQCVKFIPVNGVCDDTVRNGCSTGTANDAAIQDNASTYLWRCDGLHGGTNSEKCHIRIEDVPVDGVCNDTVRNGCTSGTANDDAIPDNASSYLWRCDGLHGGANSEKCHIRIEDVPVDGVCDDTVRNGCTSGTANDDAFADNSTGYLWRCDGLHGGTNSDKCFIRIEDVPIDGVCDDSVRNGCSAGTANDAAIPDNRYSYLWRCDGQHGGADSEKCHIRIEDVPVDGVCDEGVRNACSAGTANDAAVADTASQYRWRCDGLHAGSNSGTCYVAKPVISCDGSWSPGRSTVCSGTSFTQTRACNTGCNDGDCATTQTTTGTKTTSPCCPATTVRCGGAWSQLPSTVCSGVSFAQTRTCARCCNDGDCDTSRTSEGTKRCECGTATANWREGNNPCSGTLQATAVGSSDTVEDTTGTYQGEATYACNRGTKRGDWADSPTNASCHRECPCGETWSPLPSTVCSRVSFTQRRTCAPCCNDGDCDTRRTSTGTKDCVCGADTADVSWPADGNTCSGRRAETSVGGSDTVEDRTGDYQGEATYACNRGTKKGDWADSPTNASCQPVFCAAASKSWMANGNTCTGTLPKTDGGESATATDPNDWGSPTGDAVTGSATYTCAKTGGAYAWSGPTNATCYRYCSNTTENWGNDNACSGSTHAHSHGQSETISSTATGTKGTATATCGNGSWSLTNAICATCGCTSETDDEETAGTWSDGSGPCTTSGCRVDGGWAAWSVCQCTDTTTDGATAGTQSSTCNNPTPANEGSPCPGPSPRKCITSGCTVSCGAAWPTTPTETTPGWTCPSAYRKCPFTLYTYRRDCAEECNDGDCDEVKTQRIDIPCEHEPPGSECRATP